MKTLVGLASLTLLFTHLTFSTALAGLASMYAFLPMSVISAVVSFLYWKSEPIRRDDQITLGTWKYCHRFGLVFWAFLIVVDLLFIAQLGKEVNFWYSFGTIPFFLLAIIITALSMIQRTIRSEVIKGVLSWILVVLAMGMLFILLILLMWSQDDSSWEF